jgi:hypothetical protein
MPNTKYLCIDDQQDKTIEALLGSLSRGNLISFDRQTPVEIGLQIKQICEAAEKYRDIGFGLLLDLRLDMEADEQGNKVPYRGPTLAQELRTRMMEKEVRSFPIVLWSINDKFVRSYDADDTSHDLFDAVYGKDEQVQKQPQDVAKQMISLAAGYRMIDFPEINMQTCIQCLGLAQDDMASIHPAFLDEYIFAMQSQSRHEVAYLLLTDLIKAPGLLVEEGIVASRLGVDIENSKNSWNELQKRVESAVYRGPFGDGWPRWWWFRIEDWWNGLADKQPNLRRLTAEERIQLLNNLLGINLVSASPIQSGYSTKFFTECVATKKPLDPADGLRVIKRDRKSWHDTSFVSVYAALNRIEKDGWRIDPLDRERLDRLKAG